MHNHSHDKSGMAAPVGEYALQLSNISKLYGGVRAVDDLTLSVRQGELVTLLGPSGCGKTTSLRMVAGFVYPTEGQILIDGKDMTFVPPQHRGVGLVFQSYSLFPHLTISKNIAYGLVRRRVPRDERQERVREALEMVDLAAFGDRYPSQLSGGQQQRVALARAIVIRPRILLLDEPLSALDSKLRQRMRLEIRNLQQQIGMTTILVTHDQEEALAMSDRIIVMNKGRLVQEGTPGDIYRHPKSEFVADFVGESNMLEGSVIGPAPTAGHMLVDMGSFTCCIPADPDDHEGKRILVSIRPETIALRRGTSEPANNTVNGAVIQAGYLGARTIVQVDVSGHELLVSVPNQMSDGADATDILRRGDLVALSWSSNACKAVGLVGG